MEPRGVGVEAVEEELKKLYPDARISSFDSDRVKSKAARERTLERFKKGKIDILIGTQMLSHQNGLPPVSLVGILNPEALLAFSDFRASQKTFQALYRMMRFIAQGDEGAEIIIQTAFPDHYSIREAAAQDYPAFYEQEIELRKVMDYPPFSSVAEIVLLGREMRILAQKARDLVRQVRAFSPGIEILGPAAAPPSARRGEKGIQVILKSKDGEALDACLASCVKTISARKSIVRCD
jgi:primosomal protein N' (replication factor Y)